MKIDNLYQSTMIYDITNFMREKIKLTPEQSGLLRFCLEDNVLMNIEIDGQNYESPWRYWKAFTDAHADCCGTCNDDTLFEVERSKTELIKNSQKVTDMANKF